MKQNQIAFIDSLLARMTLEEKIGQLNAPNAQGFANTGAAEAVKKVDLEEKIKNGQVGIIAAGDLKTRIAWQKIAVDETRLGIPLAFNADVIHGHRHVWPTGIAFSWDRKLWREAAARAAKQARGEGIDIDWGPMIDVTEEPRWGRTAENPVECPYLTSEYAVEQVKGLQGDDPGNITAIDRMMAIAKHLAGYAFAKAGVDYSEVSIGPSDFHRKCLAPFKAVAKLVGGYMIGFHTLDGIPMTAHKKLLQKVVKGDWGFKGWFVTDYTAIGELGPKNHAAAASMEDAALHAFKAGIGTDLVSEAFLGHLPKLVADGKISMQEIDERCRQILGVKVKLFWDEKLQGLNPFKYLDPQRAAKVLNDPDQMAFSIKAAAECCVLLKNDGDVLPLPKDNIKIALVGPKAGGEDARADMQGTWAVHADPSMSVTIEEGMRKYAGENTRIEYVRGVNLVEDNNVAARLDVHNMPPGKERPTVVIDSRGPEAMIAEAVAAARRADVIVACVGTAKEHHGESSKRRDTSLPGEQMRMLWELRKVADEEGKKLIVQIVSSVPVPLEEIFELADGVVFSTHPGTGGGYGIAQILYGDVNPSGKTTMSFAHHSGDWPMSYADLPSGRPHHRIGIDVRGDTGKDENGRNIFRKFTKACGIEGPVTALIPFGFGKSYTSFEYGSVQTNRNFFCGDKEKFIISVPVTNTGKRAGKEVVQLYKHQPASMGRLPISHPLKELIGFEKIELQPGEMKNVQFEVSMNDLKFILAEGYTSYEEIFEAGHFDMSIGSSSKDKDLQTVRIRWAAELPVPEWAKKQPEPSI